MSNDNNFGAGFSIDISNLKAGLAAANKLIRESEAEFKAAAAGMDDWSKSQEGLEKHVASLNKMVDVQGEKVKALQREKERIISTMQAEGKSHEEIARAVDDVNGRIIKESNTLDRYKKDLDKAESALDKFNAEQEDAADEAGKAEKKLDKLGDSAEDAGDGFTVAKGAIAGFISDGLSSLASAVGNAISNIAGLSEETRELRTELAKLDTAFIMNGHSAEAAETTYKELTGVLGDSGQAQEASAFLAQLCDDEEQLATMTEALTGVYGMFGASLPLEGLAEAANESAKVGQVSGSLADALNWASISTQRWSNIISDNKNAQAAFNKAIKEGENVEDAFTAALQACATEQERAQLITDALSGAYQEEAWAFQDANESAIEANKAQAEYNETMAELGEKVEPITTAVKKGFTDILNSVLALVEDVDTAAISESIAGGFKTFIDEVIPKIKDGFQWVLDNKDGLIAGVAGIGGAFVAFKAASLVDTAVSAFKAFKLANEGATVAQWLMNAAMNANPIMLIVTLVGGLIAALVTFIATNEDARAKIVELWEKVKAAFVSFGETIKETFDKVKKWFSELGDKAAEIWGNLKQGAADAWEGIKNIFSKVASFFGDIFGDAWGRVKDIFSTGGKIFDGIKEGISSTFTNIVNRLIRGINKIVAVPFNAINSALTKIKNVEIANYKPFADKISTISVPEIPELAEGGILTRATHVIAGEAGAEAVLPLERNTGWMDMFAEKLASKMPAAGNVYQTNNFSQAHSRYELYKTKQQTAAALRLAVKGG